MPTLSVVIPALNEENGIQEIMDREFEDYSRDDLDLPELCGPRDIDAFQRAFKRITGEEE